MFYLLPLPSLLCLSCLPLQHCPAWVGLFSIHTPHHLMGSGEGRKVKVLIKPPAFNYGLTFLQTPTIPYEYTHIGCLALTRSECAAAPLSSVFRTIGGLL
ncbi:hypothetical protein FKM82_018610 [Ascaphus truei]